eukprot:TRINITY_DN6424_c0_g3_i1.p1 TRINITY_DN6424_c0_g3~~TRINITY_DN6424_c0_g3_i1.p1  ORF type:complete len:145 (-),score=63.73 TRINITY_DN6424_c0_g3_i1:19-453(-)
MSNKKQGEIDKTLKKVKEGLNEFTDIYKKLCANPTSQQKDKLDCDLKREIKKLQRFREQIKNWLPNEREKDKLNEAKRNIETQMEIYKNYEKASKTKAYSKEKLSQFATPDAKSTTCIWVRKNIEELKAQIDKLESDNLKRKKD